MSETILYKPFDGSDGIQVLEGRLLAWRDGQKVAETDLPDDESLPRLLLDFRVPELLPELEFTMIPESVSLDLEIDILQTIGTSITGTIRLDGERIPWEASCVRSEVFLDKTLPEGARLWAAEEEPGIGWTIGLPGELTRSPDTVLCQRVALAIEAFLYAIASGREVPLPYLCRVTNVFSAERPTWAAPLPHVELLGA